MNFTKSLFKNLNKIPKTNKVEHNISTCFPDHPLIIYGDIKNNFLKSICHGMSSTLIFFPIHKTSFFIIFKRNIKKIINKFFIIRSKAHFLLLLFLPKLFIFSHSWQATELNQAFIYSNLNIFFAFIFFHRLWK